MLVDFCGAMSIRLRFLVLRGCCSWVQAAPKLSLGADAGAVEVVMEVAAAMISA